MSKAFDIKEVEAAFQRAAWKAIHGTREDKAGRFTDEPQALAVKERPPASFTADNNR